MKYNLILLLIISLNAWSQNDNEVLVEPEPIKNIDSFLLKKRIDYVGNPKKSDTLCIAEIKKAKLDFEKGKIVFTQKSGYLYGDIRYEKELRQLCEEKGLIFEFELLGCVILEGQTQGCYGDYMDKIIVEKFGIDFKKNMHLLADSLFLAHTNLNNKTVQYWDCDVRPRLPIENKRASDYITTITVSDINIEKDTSEYGGWPFFDLGFIVEKDSTINGFYISSYVAHLNKNKKYKNKLFEIAVDYLKENYSVWIPGEIKGVPVRTDNNVRIYFDR